MTFDYKFSITASSKSEADEKMKSLDKLAKQFNPKILSALAINGKKFLNHPMYGGMIRKNLGL